MKGISDCIVLERSYFTPEEVGLVHQILKQVNDESRIIITKGKSLPWSDLNKVLSHKHDKFTLLYGKHFYGFEKEGKSNFYNEKAVEGYFLDEFKFPIVEALLWSPDRGFKTIACKPIDDPASLVPEAEKVITFESDNKENAGNNEPEHLDDLEQYELKKKQKEEAEAKKIYADLAQER